MIEKAPVQFVPSNSALVMEKVMTQSVMPWTVVIRRHLASRRHFNPRPATGTAQTAKVPPSAGPALPGL